EAGQLGRKTGRGFYEWKVGRPVRAPLSAVPEGLGRRLVDPLVAVTRRCVELGVVADADLADAGLIFGAGFAPCTGGPLHHDSCNTATGGKTT
ncbi:MAG TPA: crotonase, partial [Methyloversatilis sp.]